MSLTSPISVSRSHSCIEFDATTASLVLQCGICNAALARGQPNRALAQRLRSRAMAPYLLAVTLLAVTSTVTVPTDSLAVKAPAAN
jgi:hypothetical protein